MPALTLETLTLPKEKKYFNIILVISILAWILVACTIVGVFYGVIIGVFIWLGNGLLIAHLRSESVLINEKQLPDLHQTFKEVCAELSITQIPELYILQSEGRLNAFATRFSGRNFVVVYSDLLEAFGPASAEMRFFLGHELGHIKSNHIMKHILLAPGLLFPLIGNAYHRACEASCDRYGAFASKDPDASIKAMMALSGGKDAHKSMDAGAFAEQHYRDRGFFVSWHELNSSYPTLSQRVWNLFSMHTDEPTAQAVRHPMAYIFAFFTFGRGGGLVNVMFTIAIIGMLAAIAVPSFIRARQRAQATTTLNELRVIEAAKSQYSLASKKSSETIPLWNDLTPYLISSSRLAKSDGTDILGNLFIIGKLSVPPGVSPDTADSLYEATGGNEFWGSYVAQETEGISEASPMPAIDPSVFEAEKKTE